MAKGFLAGMVVGTGVAIVGAGSLSLMVGLPERLQAVNSPSPISASEPISQAPLDDVDSAPQVDAAPDADLDTPSGQGLPAPQTDAPADVNVTPAEKPELSAEVSVPDVAVEDEPAALLADAAGDEPAQQPAPDMPDTVAEDEAAVIDPAAPQPDAEADAPSVPKAPETISPATQTPGTADAVEITPPTKLAVQPPEPQPAPQEVPAPAVPAEPEQAAAPEAEGQAPTNVPDLAEDDTPQSTAPDGSDLPAPDTLADADDTPAEPPASLPSIRRPVEESAEDDNAPRIGVRAGSLTDREGAVPTGRLPTIGADAPAEDTLVVDQPDPNAPPVERYAEPIEVDEALPRMSIVLIHDGTANVGPEAVQSFPFPLTFAVDATLPNAQEIMRGYRDRGFEVLALANVPVAALPKDVEVTLAAALTAVPEAIGLIEGTGAGFQSTRNVSDQVTMIAKDGGLGLVMQPKGLNTAQQLAAKEGVPSATVFRDFDGEGQDGRVVRRFLDQAAFRARNEEAGVIMLGHMRPDTISSLVIWGLQDRAGTIALVPASMVLQAQ